MGINGQIIWTVYIKGNTNGSKTWKNVYCHNEKGRIKLNWNIMVNPTDWKRSQSLVTPH